MDEIDLGGDIDDDSFEGEPDFSEDDDEDDDDDDDEDDEDI